MKFRELLNTNQNELEWIYVYFDEDQWENEVPEYTTKDIRTVPNIDSDLNMYVDAWFVDANFCLHVLLS